MASHDSVVLKKMGRLEYPNFLNNDITATDEIFVNITGGLKTMAIMLHSWSSVNKACEFYISENNKIQWIKFESGKFHLNREENIPEPVDRSY